MFRGGEFDWDALVCDKVERGGILLLQIESERWFSCLGGGVRVEENFS